MNNQSIWIDSENYPTHPALNENITVDVAIIGGGICGISSAKILSQYNLKIAVIEGQQVGVSNTGRSTGNLYSIVDIPLNELMKKHELQTIREVLHYRKEAVDYIEKLILENNIDCDFKRVPLIKFSAIEETDAEIKDEFEIAKGLNLLPEWLDSVSEELKPFKGRCGFLIRQQAQMNPYKYVNQLLLSIKEENFKIYENTRVENIEKENEVFILKTPNGIVHAKYVIEATHTPLGFSPLQTVLGPYQEYGIAGKLTKEVKEDGIYWGYYEKGKITSLRTYNDSLLTIGEPHKVGQGNSLEKMSKLIHRARDLTLIDEVSYSWGGQHFRPADYLPYIGEGMHKNSFVATGFSTDGLTYGTLASLMMCNFILDKNHPAQYLFNAKRVTPIKSAKNFFKENMNVGKQYLMDYLKREKVHHLEKGSGIVVDYEGTKYALSKLDNGEVKVCSAICTHLGCVVHWNNAELSWDCPCHGSRFNQSGEVIEGPALKALENFESDIDLVKMTQAGTTLAEARSENHP